MGDPINTGIIGFGLSGKVFHAPFIHTHPDFHLSSVVERNNSHSRKIYPYVSILKNYDELLNDDSIELIVVATPNTFHFPMIKESLDAGKHVVVEKPFVPTSKEADELIRFSEKSGKNIFVYHNRRWDGDFLTIRKLVLEGRFGEIKYYEAHFDRFSPKVKAGAWRDENIPGSGILYDLGSHLIDQALVLFGKPDSIKADVKRERKGSPVDDYFRLELNYGDKTAVLTAGMLVKDEGPRFIIDGTHGNFCKWGIDPQETALKTGEMPDSKGWGDDNPKYYGSYGKGLAPPYEMSQIPTVNGDYMAFYDNVFDVLRKNKTLSIQPREARDVIFIIEKAFESSLSGLTIKIK